MYNTICRLFGHTFSAVLIMGSLASCGGDQPPPDNPSPVPEATSVTAAKPAADTRPNILLIVADDLGYTDLGVFGSEIKTPNIDQLANDGLVLTSYYTAPLCAPTRAELLSGTDHHLAGEGMMQANIEGAPGYEGYLNHRVETLATRLKNGGYQTYMAGKWHLGSADDQGPSARGFDRSFTLLEGGASHFGDQVGVIPGTTAQYRDDGKPVEKLPADFYSTDYYTDKMISYLEESASDGQPFFAYLTYTAPHWPIQAPQADIEQQHGRYDEGYEVLRQRRFEAWKAAGFGAPDAELPRLPERYRGWASLSDEERAASARTMEVYAAMVEHMDRQIGHLLNYLEESGQLDNTIIIFQSDNGAEAGSYPQFAGNADNSLENIGHPGSFAFIGPGWAEAGSVPFYLSKSFATEGGIRVPAIIRAPALGVPHGKNDALIMAYDIAPTLLDLTAVDSVPAAESSDVLPMTGRSFASLLRGKEWMNQRGPGDVVGREHGGNGAVRKGDWKLVWVGENEFYHGKPPQEGDPPTMSGLPLRRERFDSGEPAGVPIGPGGPWQLFNVKTDPAERIDLSRQHPEMVAELLAEWDQYVVDFGVVVKSGKP